MNRNTKKGFTIVELIIVIAVIAVLAAVLIPTFSNLIQKANVAADQTLIKNLNTALAMDTSVSKHVTMTQALEATKANGFDVEKIVARATDNKILWDSVNDCFAYSEKGKTDLTYIPDSKTDANVADYQLWTIVNSEDLDDKYSSYIAGTDIKGTVNATKGVDVGENTGIEKIEYTGGDEQQSVVIRTNGGELTVNAPNDTVAHYGKANGVLITAIHGKSYHEHGEVQGNIELKKGHIVLENTAKVGTIFVNPTEGAEVSVGSNGGTVGAVAVVKKEGVTADIKLPYQEIIDSQVTEMSLFAGGIGTEASPYLIANATQFDNIETTIGNIETAIAQPKNYKLIKDIVLGADYKTQDAFVGNLDGAGYSISVEGNGKGGYKKLFEGVANATFENIKLLQGETELILCSYTGYINNKKYNNPTTFRNIVATQEGYSGTTLMVKEKSSLLCSQVVDGDASFIDCNIIGSYVNVSGTTYMGLIVGNYIGSGLGHDITVKFDGCTFEGKFYSYDAGFLIGNCTQFFNTTSKDGKYPGKANITVKNCSNNGTISYTNSGNVLGTHAISGKSDSDEQKQLVDNFNSENENAKGEILRVDSEALGVSLTLDDNKQIIINSEKSYYYNVSFSVSTTTYRDDKEIGSHYFIVKNYIEDKSGRIETGVYYNKVISIGEQSNTSDYVNHNANLYYNYTAEGYTVNGVHDNVIEKRDEVGVKDIIAYIVVFEKNNDGVLVVKGTIAHKG